MKRHENKNCKKREKNKAQSLSDDLLRETIIHTRQKLNISQRRACVVIGFARSLMRHKAKPRDEDQQPLHISASYELRTRE